MLNQQINVQQVVDYIELTYNYKGRTLNDRFALASAQIKDLYYKNQQFPSPTITNEIELFKLYMQEVDKHIRELQQQQQLQQNQYLQQNNYSLAPTINNNSMYNNGLNLQGGGNPTGLNMQNNGWGNDNKPNITTMTHTNEQEDTTDYNRYNKNYPKLEKEAPAKQQVMDAPKKNVVYLPLPGNELAPFLDGNVTFEKQLVENSNFYKYVFTKVEGRKMGNMNVYSISCNDEFECEAFTINNAVVNKTYLAMKLDGMANTKNVRVDAVSSVIYNNHLIPILEEQDQNELLNIINNNNSYIDIVKGFISFAESPVTLNAFNDALLPIINICFKTYLSIYLEHILDIKEVESSLAAQTDAGILETYKKLDDCLTGLLKSGTDTDRKNMFATETMKIATLFIKQKEIYIANERLCEMLLYNEFPKEMVPMLISPSSSPEFHDILNKTMLEDNKFLHYIKLYIDKSSNVYHVLRNGYNFLIVKN